MRAVWSFWSPPFAAWNNCTWRSPMHHLLAWWLSLHTASKHYPETVLVTDRAGKRLLIDQLGLPFTEVSTELDSIAHAHPDWWCLGKLLAYSLQDQPFVHIDTDVFLWKPLPPNLAEAPVFAQCRDHFSRTDWCYRPRDVEQAFAQEKLALPKEWEYVQSRDTVLTAENCGILGGTNIDFLRYYSKQALDLVLRPQHAAAWSRLPDKKPYTIVIEQFFLSACVDFHRYHPRSPYRGVEVKHLFQSWEQAYDGNEAARLGFTHLIAGAKTSPVIARRLEERVRREDPAYVRVCERLLSTPTMRGLG